MNRCHALNYTASCIPDLELGALAYARDNKPYSVQAFRALIQVLPLAQHFVLPDGGRLLEDNLHGLRDRKLRLPFPLITVEYFVEQKVTDLGCMPCSKRIGIAQEQPYAKIVPMLKARGVPPIPQRSGDNTMILVNAIGYCDPARLWLPQVLGLVLGETWEAGEDSKLIRPLYEKYTEREVRERARIGMYPVPLLLEIVENYIKAIGEEKALADLIHDVTDEATAILELCEALTCVNVHVEKLQAIPKSLNDKRVIAGKLRLPDAWCLTIDVPAEIRVRGEPNGGTHRSPRTHLRRGHIRRLASGKNVWVNSTVVGSGKVKIDKHYHLIPPGAPRLHTH